MFLRNAWYVAEISTRLAARPMPIRVLDEPIVLFRLRSGAVAALEDACPHRKLPLSLGRLAGDAIECGYHGMTFDAGGRCVRVPGGQRIPDQARVRRYPVAERYGFIWIWMGDEAAAEADRIFTIDRYDDPAWGRTEPESMVVGCNYLYVTDNLLDPTHVAWVHPTSFGDAACRQTPLENTSLPSGMTVSRWMVDTEVAPFYRRFVRFGDRADRKQEYSVHFPSLALTRAIFTPAGTGGPEGKFHADAFVMDSYSFLTPIDAKRTHYFWMQARNFAPGDAAVSAEFAAAVRGAFLEDKVILEAVQKGMDEARTPHLDLVLDGGPSRFRRRLEQLITAQAGATITAST